MIVFQNVAFTVDFYFVLVDSDCDNYILQVMSVCRESSFLQLLLLLLDFCSTVLIQKTIPLILPQLPIFAIGEFKLDVFSFDSGLFVETGFNVTAW